MKDIRGIILDIDGVIVGEKIGINSPHPHESVIKALRELHTKGVVISLCTAKPHFAIRQIIDDAQLDNLHITDGGGVIIDPIDNVLVSVHIIDSAIAKKILQKYIDANIYVEFYTTQDYCIQRDQTSEITKGHVHILQREPITLENIVEESSAYEITKIMPIAKTPEEIEEITNIFQEFKANATLSRWVHPIMLPLQFGIITAPGISKKQGAIDIVTHAKISRENMLGIGDSTSDRQFIQMCKYAASVENGSQELKELIAAKGEENTFIGPSVDDHGILDIMKHFFNENII